MDDITPTAEISTPAPTNAPVPAEAAPAATPSPTVTVSAVAAWTAEAAISGLDAWMDAHVRNAPPARDGRAYETIFHAARQIIDALASVQE